MKKLITVILTLVIAILPAAVLSDKVLSENDLVFVGGWAMYADKGDNQYMFTLTFLKDKTVVQHAQVFRNNILTSDNTASGKWAAESDHAVYYSLSGKELVGILDENGVLNVRFCGDTTGAGSFVKCIDMGYTIQ